MVEGGIGPNLRPVGEIPRRQPQGVSERGKYESAGKLPPPFPQRKVPAEIAGTGGRGGIQLTSRDFTLHGMRVV